MNELVIKNPKGSVEVAQEICRWIETRKKEVMAAAEAIVVTADNYKDAQTKDAIDELAEMVEDLRDRGKKLVETVVAETEAKRVLTAIDSRLWSYSTKYDPNCAYAVLSARLKELKAQVKAFKDANTPKAPVRAVPILLYANDAGVADLCKKIADGNVAGVYGYKFAPDEATEKKVAKVFEGR